MSNLKNCYTNMFKENELHWFPMRIRHSSYSRLMSMLDQLNENEDITRAYAPLGFVKVNMQKMDFAPHLLNYVFVRSTYAKVGRVKNSSEHFEPLRFVMHPVYDEKYNVHNEVLVIPDKQMDDYIRVTQEENEKVIFLRDLKFACKPGKEVQIIEGQFAGVIGRIKRIKGSRCVVLPIGREQAVAVMDVPNRHLRYLTDEEVVKLKA